jgi:glycosyltransferase involved in cell wall biosynthesis
MRTIREARPDWLLELVTGSHGDLVAAAQDAGIPTHVLSFPEAVRRLGDAGAGGPAGSGVSKSGLLGRLSMSVAQIAALAYRLNTFIAKRTPDLIHSNGFKSHILAAWAAPRRCRVVWHVHDYVRSRPLMSRLVRLHATRCAVAITNSYSVARDLESVCESRLRIRTVHNAVDLSRFNPDGPSLDLDAAAGLPSPPAGVVRVGLVATMARWKGHEVFLRALSLVLGSQNIRGYVIGGQIYETQGSQYSVDELRRLASDLGIAQRVGFTGFIKESDAAIRALDVVVHASTRPEPFGLVVAEAMACGKPVIASDAGGVSEIISENENALSHPPGDAGAMAMCIARLAVDPDLRGKLGRHGRRWAEERFDSARLPKEVVPIYESVTEAPR